MKTFVEAVGKYTDNGRDGEAIECVQRVVKSYKVGFEVDTKADYCGTRIDEDGFWIIFHPEKFGSNVYYLSDDSLGRSIDSRESFSLNCLSQTYLPFSLNSPIEILPTDPTFLPLTLRRAAEKDLNPHLHEMKTSLLKIFGQPIEISYDLRTLLDILTLPRYASTFDRRFFQQDGVLARSIPGEICLYIKCAISKLQGMDFARDELYRSEFLRAAERGVVFEVVEKLDSVSSVSLCTDELN